MQGELNDTATVTFANVVVPESYLIGKENQGFKVSSILIFSFMINH